jgi:D-sedoheptulose 7-phosphate isomerase
MKEYIQNELQKSLDTVAALAKDAALQQSLQAVGSKAVEVIRAGKKIMLAGNGGSAADAQHIAAEIIGRLKYDRPALAAIALTTDTSVLTAVGNDYGYEKIFSRQVEGLGCSGDMFIGLSTSGNSKNVLQALESAKQKKIITVGFTGKTGGAMRGMCDYLLAAPSDDTAKIQECHIIIGHILCGILENTMFPK